MLKSSPLTPLAIPQNLQLYSSAWIFVEEFRISSLQSFSYDNFLKILNPVYVFSFAHDVLLLLLQLRG